MPAAKQWPDDQGWNFAAAFGQKEPDLIIKSHAFTMPAVAQDAWDKRVTPIGHHRAALGSGDRDPARDAQRAARLRITRSPTSSRASRASSRRPGLPTPFMEWAVGKQGEMMRPDTGKLLLPGSKFHWDIHYSQAGEEITNKVEMGIYFYPKGQEPKYRTTLSLVPAALGTLDIRPNTVAVVEGFTTLREAARIESFQPHMHLRGKAMMVEAILPTGQKQVISLVSDFNFNWMTTYVYADDVAPLLPKGTILKVTAWHDNTQRQEEQSRSEPVGGMGRSHRRRNGARVDQHRLHERRRLQGRAGQATRYAGDDRATVGSRFAAALLELASRSNRQQDDAKRLGAAIGACRVLHADRIVAVHLRRRCRAGRDTAEAVRVGQVPGGSRRGEGAA